MLKIGSYQTVIASAIETADHRSQRGHPWARTIGLHLPEHWPWAAAFDNLFTAVQTTPG